MPDTFEYRVCLVQQMRVSWENGTWQETRPLDPERAVESLESCPLMWG